MSKDRLWSKNQKVFTSVVSEIRTRYFRHEKISTPFWDANYFKCSQSRMMKPGRISPHVSVDFYHLSKAEQLLFSGKLVWEPEGKEKKNPQELKDQGLLLKPKAVT